MEQEANKTYTLTEIYFEVWKDENMEYVKGIMSGKIILDEKKSKEEQVKDAFKKRDVNSEYRNKLNAMCNALFEHNFSEVLINKGGRDKYDIQENGKNFIMFLLEMHSGKNGQILRSGKFDKYDASYTELERKYENELLYYASKYLKERKCQEHEDSIKTEELSKKLIDKFGIGNGKLMLIEALKDFDNSVNKILYESEIIDADKLDKVYMDISEMINKTTEKGCIGIIEHKKNILNKELENTKQVIVSLKEVMDDINEYTADGIDGLAKKILHYIDFEYYDEFLI